MGDDRERTASVVLRCVIGGAIAGLLGSVVSRLLNLIEIATGALLGFLLGAVGVAVIVLPRKRAKK